MATRSRSVFSLRVVQLWAAGNILGAVRDVETVTVALAVDLPLDDVRWRSEPPGSQHWANATHLTMSRATSKGPPFCHKLGTTSAVVGRVLIFV
jgi:hypothetical protein